MIKKFEEFHLKRQRRFESIEDVMIQTEYEWTPIITNLGFYEPKKVLRSKLNGTKGVDRGRSLPYFDTKVECDDWCDIQNQDLYQNMDR